MVVTYSSWLGLGCCHLPLGEEVETFGPTRYSMLALLQTKRTNPYHEHTIES